MKFFLGQLNPADKFNVIAYDSDVEAFRPTLQPVTPETIKAANGFADNSINAGGGTNIDEALKTALGMLSDDTRPSYVLFLTDGVPTVGERSERTIVSNARRADRVHARIFNLGIGFDVNGRLLDRLSREFNGRSAYVRPNEDIETYVSALSTTIGSPLLTNVDVKFEFDKPEGLPAPTISRTYPRKLTDLFAGSSFVWVGRYRESGSVKLTLSGDLGGKPQTYTRCWREPGTPFDPRCQWLCGKGLGNAADWRADRPNRSQRQKPRTDRRIGAPFTQIRHHDALHLLPCRRAR